MNKIPWKFQEAKNLSLVRSLKKTLRGFNLGICLARWIHFQEAESELTESSEQENGKKRARWSRGGELPVSHKAQEGGQSRLVDGHVRNDTPSCLEWGLGHGESLLSSQTSRVEGAVRNLGQFLPALQIRHLKSRPVKLSFSDHQPLRNRAWTRALWSQFFYCLEVLELKKKKITSLRRQDQKTNKTTRCFYCRFEIVYSGERNYHLDMHFGRSQS